MKSALRHRAATAPILVPSVPVPAAEYPLSGHSGARVVLHSKGSDSFVRKTAANPAASARLKAQADKQHAFWMLGLPFPRVRMQHLDAAGIASFDMHYIPGRTIANAVTDGGAFDPATVVKAVERLTWIFETQAGDKLAAGLFEDKIRQIERRMSHEIEDADLLRDIHTCAQMLLVRNWAGIPATPCHGDLTLENILLTAGKSIAFIDCDDGFASSYWLDFGKLFQDIDGHWCIRALYAPGMAPVRLRNAEQKLDQLGRLLRDLAAVFDPVLPRHLPQLAALGLYRAVPYAQSAGLMSFLCRRIRRILES